MNRALLTAVCTLVLVEGGCAQVATAQASDPIVEWSVTASAAATASGMAPLRTPITLAILHVAMYDAVTALGGRGAAPAGAPPIKDAAAAAAAIEAGYQVLLVEFPSQTSMLAATRTRLLESVPDGEGKKNGLDVGTTAARRLLARRGDDGRNAVVPYTPGSGAGVWIPTPPGFLAATTAFLGRVTPFTMKSPSQFRPAGPPSLDSEEWIDDYREVQALGSLMSSVRTPEQTATARFWEPLAGTVWVPTIRRLAVEHRLDLSASARFQAAAFAAFADGLIACWDAKFHFNTWRPVTAIRAGDTEGTGGTAADAGWEPLAVTPNFPEYPSGHACATAAVAYAIEAAFGRPVSIPTRNVVTGEERFFERADDVVDEVVEARMLLGLHFRSGDEDGAEIGRKVGAQIRRFLSKPRH